MINKKNKLYFKMKKDKKYKEKYKRLKHQVQKEQRHAYNTYIEKLILDLPTNDPDQSFNNQSKPKKLFSFIKSLGTDNSGVAPLKKEGQLVADTKQKANILNEQFKSVFTTESIDNIPNKGVSPHPVIPPLAITTPGIQKLLDNINPHKASGPDNISGRILKDLQNFTAQS
jgi:bacterioferritin (cytochrome b1)